MAGIGDLRGRLTGLGIGMIGPLDHANGLVRDAHGLRHWHDVPLREIAEKHLGLPVHLDKDVTAGITAEAWRHGATFGDAALIMVESGIGGGFWLGGAAHRGAHTNAGEFGHTVVDLTGPLCVCGRHGCLEIVHHQRRRGRRHRPRRPRAGRRRRQPAPDPRPRPRGAGGRGSPRHPQTYLAAVTEAVQADARRADWLTTRVALSSLGADVIAAGAAMQVLDQHYGIPELAPDPSPPGGRCHSLIAGTLSSSTRRARPAELSSMRTITVGPLPTASVFVRVQPLAGLSLSAMTASSRSRPAGVE